ncbi:MAG: hypothetical protein NT024_09380, partial [Proteobacteria bacterium]|nr:hypothetical protein [Pseudomonadota bacterium]
PVTSRSLHSTSHTNSTSVSVWGGQTFPSRREADTWGARRNKALQKKVPREDDNAMAQSFVATLCLDALATRIDAYEAQHEPRGQPVILRPSNEES